jgi:AcrR family transcriptional regulator
MTQQADRPMRADALRNREKILAAAVEIFAENGLDAHLEHIAKRAGVGPATLYRNFPTRELLIEAAHRNELTRLCNAAPDLLATLPPREALRQWLGRFIDYANAKIGMADALRALVASGGHPFARSHEMMREAIEALLAANLSDGLVRSDISAADLFAALSGVALAAGRADQRPQADRLLDLLMDALVAGPQEL